MKRFLIKQQVSRQERAKKLYEENKIETGEWLPEPESLSVEDLHKIAESVLSDSSDMQEQFSEKQEEDGPLMFVDEVSEEFETKVIRFIDSQKFKGSDFEKFDLLVETEILSEKKVLILANFVDHRHIEDSLTLSLLARGRIEHHFCRNIRGDIDLVPHTGLMKPIRERPMYRFLEACTQEYEEVIVFMAEKHHSSWDTLIRKLNKVVGRVRRPHAEQRVTETTL
ncbi:MAG: hypothetical protein KDD61_08015 [Bdellovibrionales bacterium]|nr:hypothetical protein [Bdellovibrionales bacterium]